MMNHEKVFDLSKKDEKFRDEMRLSGQSFPTSFLTGTLEKGVWAAGYSGWILGKYGVEVYREHVKIWELL